MARYGEANPMAGNCFLFASVRCFGCGAVRPQYPNNNWTDIPGGLTLTNFGGLMSLWSISVVLSRCTTVIALFWYEYIQKHSRSVRYIFIYRALWSIEVLVGISLTFQTIPHLLCSRAALSNAKHGRSWTGLFLPYYWEEIRDIAGSQTHHVGVRRRTAPSQQNLHLPEFIMD
jgi:hypothetical protein